MPVSTSAFLVVLTMVAIGAAVQGSIGFGLNLISVPVVALVAPDALPGGMIAAALPLSIFMAAHEFQSVDWAGVTWISIGRLPGLAVGLAVLSVLSTDLLGALAGAVVLLGVIISLFVNHHRITRPRSFATGSTIGFMGSTAAIEGPPLGLLYQHHAGPAVRGTLAVVFSIGTVLTLTALALTGHLAWWQLRFSIALWPALGVGLLVGRRLRRYIDAGWLRPTVLGFSAAVGIWAIMRSIFG